MRLIAIALLSIAIIVGCGTKPHPSTPSEEDAIVFPERPAYKIAFGDLISIRFFYYPNYNIDVPVRPDGVVTIPLVGEVKAEGMSPSELEDVIRSKYAEVLVEPEVSVIVSGFAAQRVFVFGEVIHPGALTYSGAMTILDAIANAGGHLPTAKLGSVILMRRKEDGSYAGKKVDVGKMLKSEKPEVVYVMPQDIIYVPMTEIAKVNVFVTQFFDRITPTWLFLIYGREAIERTGQVIIR